MSYAPSKMGFIPKAVFAGILYGNGTAERHAGLENAKSIWTLKALHNL